MVVVAEEPSFPRGGNTPKSSAGREKRQKKDDVLFKDPYMNKKKKTKFQKNEAHDDDSDEDFEDQKPNKRAKKEEEQEEDADSPLKVKAAEQLGFQHLRDGMVVLGRVQEIRDMELLISLPGRLQAYVPITNISEPYTAALKEISANDQAESDEVKSLKEMFVYGQVVPCNIVEVALDGSRRILATLSPAEVNKDLSISSLCKDMMLTGAVRSVEDHGYVMDIGMKNVRAFLRKDEAPNLTPGVGQLIRTSVKKISRDGPTCTLQLSTQASKLNIKDDFSLNSLVSGTILHVTVDKVIPSGVQVTFGKFKGIVHEQHTSTANITANMYTQGEKLIATALYTMPLINVPYLSLKPELQTLQKDQHQPRHKLALGQIIDSARVVSSSSAGSFVSLTKGCRGFVPLRHIQDVTPGVDLPESILPVNVQKRVRILQYALMDEVYICTMKKSLLKQTALRYEDFRVGQTIEGTVIGLQDVRSGTLKGKGVKVSLGRNLEGFIMPMHIADDPRLKRPELKFIPGETVTCRVLSVEPERKKVFLTHKRTLVESDEPLVASPEDAKPGQLVHGTVVMISDKGLLVSFYGEAKGWVPVAKLSVDYVENPAAVFRVGQLVKTKVEHINMEKKRIYLTLNIGIHKVKPGAVSKSSEAAPETEPAESNLPLFALVNCVVQSVEESEPGVRVKLTDSDTLAFIPQNHLSDDASLAQLLLPTYKSGQKLEDCVVYLRHPALVLSLKPSLVKLAKDQNVPQSRANVTPNLVLPVVVVANKKHVVKVHVPCVTDKVAGTIVKKTLPLGLELKIGQSLYAKVVENETKNEDVTLTAVMKPHEQQEAELGRLVHYLEAAERFRTCSTDLKGNLRHLAGYRQGQSVVGKVLSVGNGDVEVELENGVKGIVTVYHTSESELKAADLIAGVVLDICLADGVVYISPKKKLVQELSKRPEKALFTVKPNESYPGLVLVADSHYTLVQLNAPGRPLAYVPGQPLISRVGHLGKGKTGDRVVITIKQSKTGTIVGVLAGGKKAKKRNRTASESSISDVGSPKKSKKEQQSHQRESQALEVLDQDQANTLKKSKKDAKKKQTAQNKTRPTQVEKVKESLPETNEPESSGKKKKKNKKKSQSTSEDASKEAIVPAVQAQPQSAKTNEILRLNVSQGFSFDENDWSILPSATQHTVAEDSDSEDEEALTPAARQRRSRLEEEKKVAQMEKAFADPNREAQTADDHERLVLAHPNSSLHWLQYMAFYLQATEVEKARGVARRALRMIEYRAEGEKFNIWTALLNLENLYGSVESVEAVVQEAVTYNEPVKVYLQLAKIYTESGKTDLAEETYNLLLKKFKNNKEVWLTAFVFNFKRQKPDVARNQLQRAIQSLDKREHVDLLSRFAQLECKLGEIERAKTMFDTLLASYPKRVDLWVVYIDALVRSGDIHGARQVLERTVSLQLPAKKMKSLFQKFLAFEQTHGDEDRQEYVKRKALEFVNSKMGNEEA